jgi:predicted enzyme related to lactoylglutathione lyase
MARPNHFEIPVDNPDRAEGFYRDVFGWSFQRYEGAPSYYGMATTGDGDDGINGALFQRGDTKVVSITMSVDSIEDTLAKVKQKGGKVLTDKSPIPSMGWYATCIDTEGNQFGLFTEDPNASMA